MTLARRASEGAGSLPALGVPLACASGWYLPHCNMGNSPKSMSLASRTIC